MVSDEWLVAGDNINYDIPGRIGENGAAWGDFESEQVENNRKRVQEEKEIEKRKKQKTGEGGSNKKSRTGKGRSKKSVRASGKEKEKTVEPNYDDDEMDIY